MPVIRDLSINVNNTNTVTGMICALPDAVTNDLMIMHASADTGTQNWAGLEVLTVFQYEDVGVGFTVETTDANSSATADINWTPATAAAGDLCYWGSDTPFNAIGLLISTAGAGTQTWVFEYWNGSAWTTLTNLNTGISLTAAAGYRFNNFNPPGDWATTTINSSLAYYVRMRISAYTSQTTRPVGSQAFVGKWNQLFSLTNTTNQGILYKIAGASEPEEAVGAFTTAETSNIAITSIRNVDTAIPFATATMTSYSTQNSDQAVYSGSVIGVSQSFTATAFRMSSVKFYLKKVGSPTGNVTVELRTHSGTLGTSSIPTGVALAISNTLDITTLTTSYQLIEFTFPWYFQYLFTATNFCVTVNYSGGDVSNCLNVGYNSSSGHGGNKATNTGGTWTAQSGHDCYFAVTNFTFTSSTTSAAKANMPTMTTSRDKSMVLYIAANSGTGGMPSILEGACSLHYAKDGSAHSDCMSWGIKETAGTTPADIGYSTLSASASSLAVLTINPPTTNIIVPPYCASETSVYVSPLTGAAYNSDSVPAATITTPFTGTINGKTLSNGGATVTRTDVGINSYHAMVNFTGLTTNGIWAGIRQTMVARTTLAGKNILFHIQPYLPVDIQTTDSVTRPGVKGIAIGLASTTSNFKVWHVGGAGTPFGVSRHQPVVINTSATAGVIQSTGTLNTASITELGLMVSGKVTAPNWLIGSCWALDTTVIAGGISTEPIDIPGIIAAYSYGKERRSAIQQGSGQALILGPVQIGDGGTNPAYLLLDSTALEFPRQYSETAKEVYYNSIDNYCGLIYYPGASDTIIHRNSVLTSPSRYKWGLHASASTSATYDFSGTQVIGAGTITLGKAIIVSELTINDYSTLDITACNLQDCTINEPPATNDSVTTNGSTLLERCFINVTTVTAGNRWLSVANPEIFEYCTFTGSGSTGHAIRITTPGTYDLIGNVFTGFGADTTNFAAIYNDSGGLVTLNITDGGTAPTYRNGAGASTVIVAGAVDITINVKDATTAANIQNARVFVETSDGAGPFPYQESVTITRVSTTASVSHTGHGLSTGDKVVIRGANQQEYNGIHTITVTGTNGYDFTVAGSPTTPATGTIISSFIIIEGLTDASGNITTNRVYSTNQNIKGTVRKASAPPYYKPGSVIGAVNSTTGFSTTIQLIPD